MTANKPLEALTRRLLHSLRQIRRAEGEDRRVEVFVDWLAVLDQTIRSLRTTGLGLMRQTGMTDSALPGVFAQLIWGELKSVRKQLEPNWRRLLEVTELFLTGSLEVGLYDDVLGEVMLSAAPGLDPTEEAGWYLHDYIRYVMAYYLPDGTEILLTHLRHELAEQFTPDQIRYFVDVLRAQPAQESENPLTRLILDEIRQGLTQPIRPLVILDGHCQTGRAILACARRFPRWAVTHGFIFFYGYEINPIMRQIARLNCDFCGVEASFLSAQMLEDHDALILKPDFTIYPLFSEADEPAV